MPITISQKCWRFGSAASLLGAVAAGCATPPQPRGSARDVAIDFAAEGSIADWHSENDRQLYIMDRTGSWYLATFDVPCPQLDSSAAIAFEPGQSGRFDRFSTVISAGVRCRVSALVHSERPRAKSGKPPGRKRSTS
jgi:hypothetical protein